MREATSTQGWQRQALADDERGRGVPAVVGYGPYLFVSGADGHRRLSDERIDVALTDNPEQQCRNAYARIVRRLERAGHSGDSAVSVQNFTSGQYFRAARMNLWPEYFGEKNHQQVVSFGAQARMNGINMLSAIAIAVDPSVPRVVPVASPGRGRASRITQVGALTFVIGVRGYTDPRGEHAVLEEVEGSFEAQFDNCMRAMQGHLQAARSSLNDFVRIDAALRAARYVAKFETGVRREFEGRVPFGMYAVGMPLGARGELEIGGIAVSPNMAADIGKTVTWSAADPSLADVTSGGGLAFVRNVSGARDESRGTWLAAPGDLRAQVRQAVRNVEQLLQRRGLGMDGLLRFDVFVRDIYDEDDVIAELVALLGARMPATTIIGAEPLGHAEIEITAVASCPAQPS